MRDLPCGRRAERKSVDWVCRVRGREGRSRKLRISDLSSHGAWLRCDEPFAPAEQLQIAMTLPAGATMTLTAEVMWAGDRAGAGVAVEFVAMHDSARAALIDALAELPAADTHAA